MNEEAYDLIVIGGGPAGHGGALAAGFSASASRWSNGKRARRRGHQYRHDPEQDAARDRAAPLRLALAQALRRGPVAAARGDGRRFHAPRSDVRRASAARRESRMRERRVEAIPRHGRFRRSAHDPRHANGPATNLAARRANPHRHRLVAAAPAGVSLRATTRVHDSDEILELTATAEEARRDRRGRDRQRIRLHVRRARRRGALVDGRDVLLPFLDAEISRALADGDGGERRAVPLEGAGRPAATPREPGDVVLTLVLGRDSWRATACSSAAGRRATPAT